jgi:hypothetical protein
MEMYLKMNQAARIMLYVACAAAVLLLLSTTAVAQTTDVFSVTYFDNNTATGAPVAIVHVLNPGNGALCADVYVLGADQELSECCSCPITPNGLLTFTVDVATSNPGDGNPQRNAGSIDIIADSSASCNASSPSPTPDLRAWATHINRDSAASTATATVFDVTEDEFLDTPLSSGEQSELAGRCGFFQANSSGRGDCSAICTETSPTPALKTGVKAKH